jgi:hypothetical protein
MKWKLKEQYKASMKQRVVSLKIKQHGQTPSQTNNNIRDEKGDIMTNTNEIQRIITKYFKNLHCSKLESLEEIDNRIYMNYQT